MKHLNIVIGMGGTGGRIISEIKRIERQKKYYAEAHGKRKVESGSDIDLGFRYLYYDTNDDMLTSTEIWESSYGSYELDRDREWIQADRELLYKINTGDNAFGSTWLSDKGEISFSKAADAKGAEQRRRLGRILFASIKHKFDEHLDLLLSNSGSEDRLVVHLVGSPAGGTGGGALLDALMILSERTARLNAEIRLYVATPEDAPRGYTADRPFYSNIYQFFADLNELLAQDKNWYTLGARSKGSGLYPNFNPTNVSVFIATDATMRNTRYDFSRTKQEKNSSGVYETTYSSCIEGKIAEFILCNKIPYKRDANNTSSDKDRSKQFLGFLQFYTFGIDSISSGESLKRENFAALVSENIINKFLFPLHDSASYGYTFQSRKKGPEADEVRQHALDLLKASGLTSDHLLFRKPCEPLEVTEPLAKDLKSFIEGSFDKYLTFLKEDGFQEAQSAIYNDVMLYIKSRYKEKGVVNQIRDLVSKSPRIRARFLQLFKENLMSKVRQPDRLGGLENVASYFDSAIEQFVVGIYRQLDEVDLTLKRQIDELKLEKERFSKRLQGRLFGGVLVPGSKKKNELEEFKDVLINLSVAEIEQDHLIGFARNLAMEMTDDLKEYREGEFAKLSSIIKSSAEFFTNRRKLIDQSFLGAFDQGLKGEFKAYESFKREFCEQENIDLAIQSKVDDLVREVQSNQLLIERKALNSRIRTLARECIEEVSKKKPDIFNPDALRILKQMDRTERVNLINSKIANASPLARLNERCLELNSRSKIVVVPRSTEDATEHFVKDEFRSNLSDKWGEKVLNEGGDLDEDLKDIYFIEVVSDVPLQVFRAVSDRFGPSFYGHTLNGFGKDREVVAERRFDTAIDPYWYRCRSISGDFDSDGLGEIYHSLVLGWSFVASVVGVLAGLSDTNDEVKLKEALRSFRKSEGYNVLSDESSGVVETNFKCKGFLGFLEVIEASHRQTSNNFSMWKDGEDIIRPAEFSTDHKDFRRLNLLVRIQNSALGQMSYLRGRHDGEAQLLSLQDKFKGFDAFVKEKFLDRFDSNRRRKIESAVDYANLVIRREVEAGC